MLIFKCLWMNKEARRALPLWLVGQDMSGVIYIYQVFTRFFPFRCVIGICVLPLTVALICFSCLWQ